MRRFAAPALLALLLVVPLAVGVWLAVRALSISPLESSQATGPTVGVVEATTRTDQISTTARFVAGDPLPVLSQSTGLVTEMAINPGTPVETGDIVMHVDGSPVTAYVSVTPLHRNIVGGLTGDDVAIAQTLLADLGYQIERADGRAGPRTVAAIEEFNNDRGLGDDNGVLSLGSLLWIPEPSEPPASLSVSVGTTLTPGVEVYVSTSAAPSVTLALEPSDQERVVTVADVSAELPPGAVTITDPGTVEAIGALQGEELSVPAIVMLAEPRQVGAVPATAVVTDAEGKVCFFPSVDGSGVVVEATEGSFGMVDVDAELVGTPVLLNPRDVRADLACD